MVVGARWKYFLYGAGKKPWTTLLLYIRLLLVCQYCCGTRVKFWVVICYQKWAKKFHFKILLITHLQWLDKLNGDTDTLSVEWHQSFHAENCNSYQHNCHFTMLLPAPNIHPLSSSFVLHGGRVTKTHCAGGKGSPWKIKWCLARVNLLHLDGVEELGISPFSVPQRWVCPSWACLGLTKAFLETEVYDLQRCVLVCLIGNRLCKWIPEHLCRGSFCFYIHNFQFRCRQAWTW